jgi:hypothetical protein
MYLVESYDARDEPVDRRFATHGQFATAAKAVAAAKSLIDEHLVLAIGAGLSVEQAFEEWRVSGEVPRIVARSGAPPVDFNPFVYAQTRARELHRRG